MSAPVDIVHPSSAFVTSDVPSGSPTGKYVPIHKRSASVAPSCGSSPPRHSARSPARGKRARSPSSARSLSSSAVPRARLARPATPIPTHHTIPIYSIPELIALSASPLVQLPSVQRERMVHLFPTIVSHTVSAPTASAPEEKAPLRRRRAGRKSSAKKLQAANVSTDVESRRRRHGAWGWHEHVPLEDSWRHPAVVAVSV
ncbi:hypothetical protein BKA93DRAFT_828650 [Sparassis latifolia]